MKVLYIPALAGVFGVAPLSRAEWSCVLWLSAPVILLDEAMKLASRSRRRRRDALLSGVIGGGGGGAAGGGAAGPGAGAMMARRHVVSAGPQGWDQRLTGWLSGVFSGKAMGKKAGL
jgi:hypothetical protein